METRPFGKTGASFPILSFGGQRIVDEHNCTEEEAIKIVNTAIDRGIRYFDTSPGYCDNRSQPVIGEALAGVEDEELLRMKLVEVGEDAPLEEDPYQIY